MLGQISWALSGGDGGGRGGRVPLIHTLHGLHYSSTEEIHAFSELSVTWYLFPLDSNVSLIEDSLNLLTLPIFEVTTKKLDDV